MTEDPRLLGALCEGSSIRGTADRAPPSNAHMELANLTSAYAAAALSPNTIRAYDADLRAFTAFCAASGMSWLPAQPAAVALYLARLAQDGRKVSTIGRACHAIAAAHHAARLDSPCSSRIVREVLRGIRRSHGSAATAKRPISPAELRAMLTRVEGPPTRALRDRAILLVDYAGAFRRSELAALNIADVEFCTEGLRIHLGRSKTDQEGMGRKVAVAYSSGAENCPVRALQAWLTAYGVDRGPLFVDVTSADWIRHVRISDRMIARLIKRLAARVGIDPARVSGHSMRSGFVTAAARLKHADHAIMRQTGHKKIDTLLRYIREANLFVDNASVGVLDAAF